MGKIQRRLTGVVLAILVATGSAAAQSPARDPARLAAAKELFTVMGSEAQFEIAIDTMTSGMAGIAKQRHPGQAAAIDEVFTLLKQKFKARSNEVVEMIAPLWAEAFTAAEMTQIAAFFRTEIGRKFIAAQPSIMQKSMQAGMVWGQRIGQEVEAEARSELKKRGVDL